MTNEELITAIDSSAKEEAGTIFGNIFVAQVSGRRINQDAVDHCVSSLRLLSAFQFEVTKQLKEGVA
jgi:hypothetical protein